MPKLAKQYYYSQNGKRKINCYKAPITKEMLKKTDIKEDDNINIYVKDNKIIIERG